MLTRCPHLDCKETFELPADPSPASGLCLVCSKPMFYRSLLYSTKMDERSERLTEHLFTHETINDPKLEPIVVVCEDVRSLWNVGSIFRTADGAGISRLVLCGITGNPPRKEIAKTSLGAEDTVAWNYVSSALKVILPLQKLGYQIVGLERTENSQAVSELLANGALKIPMCLIVGNEVTGLSAEVLHYSDIVCHLPMRGMKESLNVAVAFGIAAYAITESLPQLCPTRM